MIGDIIRLVATFQGVQSEVAQWVWHYRQTVGTDDDPQDIVDAAAVLLGLAWADLDGFINTAIVGDTLELLTYDPVLDQFNGEAVADISSLAGQTLDDVAPGNVAPYVGFPTNVGRSRGKKFIFGMVETAIAAGALTAPAVAAMATFAAAFNDTLLPGNTTWRPGNFNQATQFLRLWEQTVVTVGAFSGSQYRRLPGRGV